MDWQQVTSLLIVAATTMLLVRSEWRRRRRARLRACGGECGCSSSILEQVKTQSQLTYTNRIAGGK
jgi:hypothetical protein